jgi:flagellar biosynthesis protein FlhB
VLILTMSGPALVQQLGDLGMTLLAEPDRLAPRFLTATAGTATPILGAVAPPLLLLFGLPTLLIIAVAFAQRALVFVPNRIAPRWSRLSPAAALKSRLGREGLVNFAKSLTKAVAVLLVLTFALGPEMRSMFARYDIPAAPSALWLLQVMLRLLAIASVMAVVFGGLDYGWQWWLFRQRAMMSREELKAEMKDQEGDPHLKAHRRQRAQEIAMNRMLADVKTADVILVNPTHYAVALKWKRQDSRPPVVVAKGVDEIAARIRERAAEAGVPIFRDPPTARALYAQVDIGKTIRPDHYKAVAAAIRFGEAMRKRAKALSHAR